MLKIGKDGLRAYDIMLAKINMDFTGFPLFSLEETVEGADCLVLLVDHKEFKEIKLDALLKKMRGSLIIDTRGIWLCNEPTNHQNFEDKRHLPGL